jgi:hypothetical protein
MTDTLQIKLNIPSADNSQAPDFMLRLYRASLFREKMESGKFDSTLIKSMIDFLTDYLEDKDKYKDDPFSNPLWHCSSEQFMACMNAFGGGAEEIPPTKSETLDTPFKDTLPTTPNGPSV